MSNKLPERSALKGMEIAATEMADLVCEGRRDDPRYELVRLQALDRFVTFGTAHLDRYAKAMEDKAVLIERLAASLEQCNEIINEQAAHIDTLRTQIDGPPQRLH